MSKENPKDKSNKKTFDTKKCPECFAYLPLNATVCTSCKKKVGKVDKHGLAKKPLDWKAYVLCLVSWIIFGLYMWWAFFRV